MAKKKLKIGFFLDENVPNAVGKVLESAGHEVHYLNREDVVLRGSKDPLVARAAAINNLVLVSQDGDMKKIALGYGATNSIYKNLNLLKLSCEPPDAALRVKEMISLIEFEWKLSEGAIGRRIHIDIMNTVIRIHR